MSEQNQKKKKKLCSIIIRDKPEVWESVCTMTCLDWEHPAEKDMSQLYISIQEHDPYTNTASIACV